LSCNASLSSITLRVLITCNYNVLTLSIHALIMPPPKAPGGKQRTISSFFTPKQPLASSSQAIPKPKEPTVTVGNKNGTPPAPTITKTAEDGKETVTVTNESEYNNDDDDGDDDEVPVSRMRRKGSKRKLAEEEDYQKTDGNDDELYSIPAKKKKLRRYNDEEAAASSPPVTTTPKKQAVPPQVPTTRYRYNPGQKVDVDTAVADPERTKQKQKLREQFVKKLGREEVLAAGSREEADLDGETAAAAEEEEEEEPELGPIAKRFGRGKVAAKPTAKKGGLKLTPLEKQVVEIKLAHPDTVLVVEVGYKFRFFGEDARIASQNLSIMCIPGKMRFDNHPSEAHYDRFASASIPVPRLHVHVKRLVSAGYKVGVVRQLETAALKAAGDNRNAPFERKLTNLYTKGTYIDDVDGLEGGDLSSGAGSGGAPNTGFLLAITEKPGGGSGADEKVHVGIVAVQPSTGEVVYDEFDDGFMRSELETRLLHSRRAPLGPLVETVFLTTSSRAVRVFDRGRVDQSHGEDCFPPGW
jgi:DNA mismatch repair protein MSH3